MCRQRQGCPKNLFVEDDDLFYRLCSLEMLRKGFKAVKHNQGSPGIDGVTIEAFESHLDQGLKELKRELETWTYKPQPVRRVEIPKPGKSAGVCLLGIPCIRDRVVQATLKQLLEPILDPLFSDNSYGFRPGRNQTQAVQAAQQIVGTGKQNVALDELDKELERRGLEPYSYLRNLFEQFPFFKDQNGYRALRQHNIKPEIINPPNA